MRRDERDASGSLGARLIGLGARAYARVDLRAEAVHRAARLVAHGVLHEALTLPEKSALGVQLYDLEHRGAGRRDLFEWERPWFARRLPPPPARLFVGAAGAGREVAALCAAGYRVDALEPAPRPAAACAAVLGDRGAVHVARFEELSRSLLDGGGPVDVVPGDYDAVLLGWGALSHVLEPAERTRLIRAADRLAPRGPILASFWLGDGAHAPGRAERLGRAAGRAIRALRGHAPPDEPLQFGSWYGFSHYFSRAEIEALAAEVGRTVVWEPDASASGYPHATFAPG